MTDPADAPEDPAAVDELPVEQRVAAYLAAHGALQERLGLR